MDGDLGERSRPFSGEESGRRKRARPRLTLEEREGLLRTGLGVDPGEPALASLPMIDDAESITRFLRGLLRQGKPRVGGSFQSDDLADAFDVHRNTISKVLRTLEGEGYLHRRKGRPARVVSHDPPALPRRRTQRISHTRIAEDHRLDIRTVPIRCEQRAIEDLKLDDKEQSELAARLALPHRAPVIVYSRIRELRAEGGEWMPAIAEIAYFAQARAPEDLFHALCRPGQVESIHRYFADHNITPITSEYRIRVARLPKMFHRDWARLTGDDRDKLEKARFLRFESTTHSVKGPIELSIASLVEGLFTLGTTDLSFAIEPAELYRQAPSQTRMRHLGVLAP